MIRNRLIILLMAAVFSASGAAVSADVYKWTDADGNVQYGDRPSGQPTEERVRIASRRTDSSAVQARVQTRREAKAAREEAARDAPKEKSKDEQRAERKERADKCQQYRDRLESFLQSERLYRQNENGEREYLEEQEILDARAGVQEKIQEYCD